MASNNWFISSFQSSAFSFSSTAALIANGGATAALITNRGATYNHDVVQYSDDSDELFEAGNEIENENERDFIGGQIEGSFKLNRNLSIDNKLINNSKESAGTNIEATGRAELAIKIHNVINDKNTSKSPSTPRKLDKIAKKIVENAKVDIFDASLATSLQIGATIANNYIFKTNSSQQSKRLAADERQISQIIKSRRFYSANGEEKQRELTSVLNLTKEPNDRGHLDKLATNENMSNTPKMLLRKMKKRRFLRRYRDSHCVYALMVKYVNEMNRHVLRMKR